MNAVTIKDNVLQVTKWNPRKDAVEREITYIDISGVSQDSKEITSENRMPGSDAPSRARQLISQGDVLVSTVRPNLNAVAVVPERLDGATASTGFCVLRPIRDKLDTRYLFHWVRSPNFVASMTGQATGQSYPAVSDKIVKSSEIPLPVLAEQKRIAAILDQADELRHLRQTAIDKLSALRKSIFNEMFGDPTVNEKGFDLARLGDVCDVRDGTHDSPKYVEDGFPLLTSKNFSSGSISMIGAKFISREDFDKINKRSKVDIGDIVMPMIGTIGSPVIVEEEPNFAIKNVALIKFVNGQISRDFVQVLLNSEFLERNVAKTSRGGTQKFVSLGDLRNLRIPVPPPEFQIEFSERVKVVKATLRDHDFSRAHCSSLFSSLQHRAFRGEL